MTNKQHADYRKAETLTHMLDKIEELMVQDKRLKDAVESLELLKKQIANKLVKEV